MSNWQAVSAPDGRVYYWNKVTNETVWECPPELQNAPSSTPPPALADMRSPIISPVTSPRGGAPEFGSSGSRPGGGSVSMQSFASRPGPSSPNANGGAGARFPSGGNSLLSPRQTCEQCHEGKVAAKVTVTDVTSGERKELRMCKQCAIASKSEHDRKKEAIQESMNQRKLSRSKTVGGRAGSLSLKVGKYKKKESENQLLKRKWGLDKSDAKQGQLHMKQKLTKQLVDLDEAIESESKGRKGLEALVSMYANDPKQQATVKTQISDSKRTEDTLRQQKKMVDRQYKEVCAGRDPCGGVIAAGRKDSKISIGTYKAPRDEGDIAAHSRKWGLRSEHAHLDRDAKLRVLHAQLEELSKAFEVEQKGKAGLKLLMDGYRNDAKQLALVEDQVRDINQRLGKVAANIDKVKSDIKGLTNVWQEVKDDTSGSVYYWNTQTNEVQWTPPPELGGGAKNGGGGGGGGYGQPQEQLCEKCQRNPVSERVTGYDGTSRSMCHDCARQGTLGRGANIQDQWKAANLAADNVQRDIDEARQMHANMMQNSNGPPPVPPAGPPPEGHSIGRLPPAQGNGPPPMAMGGGVGGGGPSSMGGGGAPPPAAPIPPPVGGMGGGANGRPHGGSGPPPPVPSAGLPPPGHSIGHLPPPASAAPPAAPTPPPAAPTPPPAAPTPPPAAPTPPPAAKLPPPMAAIPPPLSSGGNGGGGGGGGPPPPNMSNGGGGGGGAPRGRGGGGRGRGGPGGRGVGARGGIGMRGGGPRRRADTTDPFGRGGGGLPDARARSFTGAPAPSSNAGTPSLSPRSKGGSGVINAPMPNAFPSLSNLPPPPSPLSPRQSAPVGTPPISAGASHMPDPRNSAPSFNAPPPQQFQQPQAAAQRSRYMQAIADFQGVEEGELSLRKGDVVEILDADPDGWWRVSLNGVIGYAPSNHLSDLTS